MRAIVQYLPEVKVPVRGSSARSQSLLRVRSAFSAEGRADMSIHDVGFRTFRRAREPTK